MFEGASFCTTQTTMIRYSQDQLDNKLTPSNSGFPRQPATASQNLTAARSTGSAGYVQARSSICVERSGVESGISRN